MQFRIETAGYLAVAGSSPRGTVIKSSVPIFVDCRAPWCAPCKRMFPIVQTLAKDYKGRVRFYEVDLDETRARHLSAHTIPNGVSFKNGESATRLVGIPRRDELRSAACDTGACWASRGAASVDFETPIKDSDRVASIENGSNAHRIRLCQYGIDAIACEELMKEALVVFVIALFLGSFINSLGLMNSNPDAARLPTKLQLELQRSRSCLRLQILISNKKFWTLSFPCSSISGHPGACHV